LAAVLAQHDDTGKKENAIYYISKSLLWWIMKKSTPLSKNIVWPLSGPRRNSATIFSLNPSSCWQKWDPLKKYIFEKSVVSSRTARWQMFLLEFDITYLTQKSIKGQAIADHLAHHPLPAYEPVKTYFPDEQILFNTEHEENPYWQLYFDGSVHQGGSGIGFVMVSPEGVQIPKAFKLWFQTTNNEAEYEALIAGLNAAINLDVHYLRVTGDSLLVISQVTGEWQVKEPRLIPYANYVKEMLKEF
jgi:hypothetical protein